MAPIQRRGLAALQLWCEKVTAEYPNVTITDLSTSFRDGLAFNAIIHHFRPQLFDYYSLKPSDILGNNAHAFKIAEDELNIPALLDPVDMVETEEPDKKSVSLYLAQFYHLFKNEETSSISSPNISLNRLSESDSIVQSSSSDGSESSEGTPSATPITTRTSRHFNRSRNELVEKYGEDIFNNGKDDDDGDKFGKRSNKIWDKLESQNKKTAETPTNFFSNKNSPSVASMCKHFENAKISAS
jgi:hypothetical protein